MQIPACSMAKINSGKGQELPGLATHIIRSREALFPEVNCFCAGLLHEAGSTCLNQPMVP